MCTQHNYFTWRGKFYKQVEGTPMGSPLSPILANIFLLTLESKIVSKNNNIILWCRYVDDVFAIIRSRFQDTILTQLNNFHPSISFTTEEEQNGKIPFLDILITTMDDGAFNFTVYRKSTHTNRYLNFDSFHAFSHKQSVIDSLVTRAYTICHGSDLQQELLFITKFLQENGYPKRLIEKRIQYLRDKTPSNNDDDLRLILPFMGHATYRITRFLRTKLRIKFGFLTGQKLSSLLSNHKDILINNEKPGIYEISCSSCPSKYIGETSRNLKTRLKEHIADIRHNRVTTSAVALHCAENPSHTIDSNCAKLLEIEKNCFRRKFKEALYIQNTKDRMNLDTGMRFNIIWSPLLLPLCPIK